MAVQTYVDMISPHVQITKLEHAPNETCNTECIMVTIVLEGNDKLLLRFPDAQLARALVRQLDVSLGVAKI